MVRVSVDKCRRLVLSSVALAALFAAGCSHPQTTNRMMSSDHQINLSETTRDLEGPSKLSPALERLVAGSDASRDIGEPDKDEQAITSSQIGLPVPGTKDLFQVTIHVTPSVDLKALAAAGANIQTRLGNVIYATVHVHDMGAVSDVDGVEKIDAVAGGKLPTPPKATFETAPPAGGARDLESGKADAVNFDHTGLTGKGVIVGVIDTGIDWRHPDFINPDGTSRIKYLWDIYDDSWSTSNHTIGSEPPLNWEANKPMGTLYTNAQINAALKGEIKISRPDTVGHGTACAGTAAGNGLGVAPEADLIFVATHRDSKENPDNDGDCALPAANWIRQIAESEHKPCVISLSFGGSLSPHDGSGDEDEGYSQVLDHGNAKGVVICVSAGNNGQDSMHARGRFGPGGVESELTGGMSSPIQLIVTKKTLLTAYFDSRDDWGLLIEGNDKFLVGTDGKPGFIKLCKKTLTVKSHSDLSIAGSDNLSAEDRQIISSSYTDKSIDLQALPNGTDMLVAELPPGIYYVSGGGHSRQVKHGVFDLYLPESYTASFGMGGDHKMVVGSPGDSDDVITVGSYDCCNQWTNLNGKTTYSGQVDLGNISGFSSAGFRDGAIKPDIAGPGDFIISAFAQGSGLSMGDVTITQDGKHVAWRGTSASCPYTAGVVALMLQKNAELTANQTKKILRDTADHDLAVTGAVPNGEWGYGKLNAEKAIAAVTGGTPAPSTPSPAPVITPSPAPTPAPSASANFAGSFKGDGIAITLEPAADGFTGEMTRGGKTFPLSAHVTGNQLQGVAVNNGHDFSFIAQIDGDVLTLHAGDKAFVLARQNVILNGKK